MRLFLFALAFASTAGVAFASETITYTYDDLGRLVVASKTGGSNDGNSMSITYDPAGNRTHYQVALSGSTNNAPVANTDSGAATCNSYAVINLVANDTDADGDAITLISITKTSGPGGANVSSATSATVYAGTTLGQSSVYSYKIQDIHGAQATGTLNFQTVGSPTICA